MDKDFNKKIFEDKETGELLSLNDLLIEFNAWKEKGVNVGHTFHDFIKSIEEPEGPCRKITKNAAEN